MVLRSLSQSGSQTAAPDVTTCFVPLLRWIVTLWTGTHLALALDATTLGARFVALTPSRRLSRMRHSRGLCPLALNQPGAWRREWLRLLRGVRPAIPPDWTVLVLADRGLWARWLFGRIVRLGWHPRPPDQQRGQVPSGRPDTVVLAPRVGPRREPVLVWPGDRLCLAGAAA